MGRGRVDLCLCVTHPRLACWICTPGLDTHHTGGGHLLQSAQSSRAEPASFVDILEERRRGSDISHALRAFSPPPGCGAPPPSPSALNKMVLESQHLRYVVLEVAAESGKPQARVREEAAALLDEMSQNLQVTFIRLLGFALSKIFTRLFRRIRVNEDGLARLQQATQEHPVILMPNHRTLMGMSLIGEIFRRSGAFFIRRAIGSDKLYWAVLSEYVRTIVRMREYSTETVRCLNMRPYTTETVRCLNMRAYTTETVRCLNMRPYTTETVRCLNMRPYTTETVRCLNMRPYTTETVRCLNMRPYTTETVRCLNMRPYTTETVRCLNMRPYTTETVRCLNMRPYTTETTGFAPVEFYVEGLRSRTLKSLTPKMGMMHMVLEPFLKGEVYDLSLVPVSISYDRVLEESLLAHELLGVPKPRETTRGLLKARRVLEQDYGSMHVYFGNPVSVRELAKGRIGRGQYNLVPRDLPGRPSEESQAFASAAAHRVVRLQERGTVLSPWSLTALLVLQRPDGTRWDLLARDTLWLRGIALQLGARLDWPADRPDLEVMSSSMALHRSVVRCEEGCVWLVEEAGPEPVTQEEGVFRRASAVLMCASYRNQALHVFTRPAMVAVAMGTVPGHSQEDIYRHFCFLRDLFANEFVFVPGCGPQDFEEGCSGLQQCGAVSATDHELKPTEEERDTIVFLSAILEPFIETYQVVFRILCDERLQVFTEKSFVPAVRADAMKLLISGNPLSCVLRLSCISLSPPLIRLSSSAVSLLSFTYSRRILCRPLQVKRAHTNACPQTPRRTSSRLCSGWGPCPSPDCMWTFVSHLGTLSRWTVFTTCSPLYNHFYYNVDTGLAREGLAPPVK
ncbi:hypothetical protein P4O66_019930 [Electrophorus voltai]|uniref:GPAT/DHAPAT C-terminal domain-containing protein n=1 Tax=Electrophorus voltai TaxID=2609070 RepID=A0AAD8ZWT6_9TELE|nr:hypothetical protein P4O66_019930 [Electrophorus voltai]